MSEFPPRGALSVSYGEACHQGKVREENQDSIRSASIPLGDLFLVADGIGGYQGGATASRMVVEGFVAQLGALPANYPADHALAEACTYTNASIYAAANTGDPKLQRMGSTVVLALVQAGEAADFGPTALAPAAFGPTALAPAAFGPTAWIGHVGDSRAYLIRGGKMTRITSDHSAVQALVSRNLITEEEARNHPDASVLTRSLGHRPEVEIELDRVPLQAGDALLLCSDGLWGYVADADMAAIATDPNLSVEKVAEYLLDLALSAGGHDNIGIEFFRIGGVGAPAAAAAVPASVKGSQRSTLPSMNVIKTAPFARPSEAAPSPALAATPEPPAQASGHRKQIVIAVCLLALAVGGALGLVARSHWSASSHKTDNSGAGGGAVQIGDPAAGGPPAPQRGSAKHSSSGTVQPGVPGSNPRPNPAGASSETRIFGIVGEIDLGPYRAPAPEEIPLRHTTIRRESKVACVNLATAETVAYVNKPELSNDAIVEAIVKSYPKVKDHMEAHAVKRREMTQEVKEACGSDYDAIVILASKVAAKASAAPANDAQVGVPHTADAHDPPAPQFRHRQADQPQP